MKTLRFTLVAKSWFASVIACHKRQSFKKKPTMTAKHGGNCRDVKSCPLDGHCLKKHVENKAIERDLENMNNQNIYDDASEIKWKKGFNNHQTNFGNLAMFARDVRKKSFNDRLLKCISI